MILQRKTHKLTLQGNIMFKRFFIDMHGGIVIYLGIKHFFQKMFLQRCAVRNRRTIVLLSIPATALSIFRIISIFESSGENFTVAFS